MKKHHIDRLEKLYTFLGTVKPTKFYFGNWASTNGDPDTKLDVNVCGTTACALGWAGSMPEFRKRGLKLVWDKEWQEGEVWFTDSDGDRAYGEDAGAKFFGLTDKEAWYLFIPDTVHEEDMPLNRYRQRLRTFINRKKRELKLK